MNVTLFNNRECEYDHDLIAAPFRPWSNRLGHHRRCVARHSRRDGHLRAVNRPESSHCAGRSPQNRASSMTVSICAGHEAVCDVEQPNGDTSACR